MDIFLRRRRGSESMAVATHDPVRPQAVDLVLHLVHQIWSDVVETDSNVAHCSDSLQCSKHVEGLGKVKNKLRNPI